MRIRHRCFWSIFGWKPYSWSTWQESHDFAKLQYLKCLLSLPNLSGNIICKHGGGDKSFHWCLTFEFNISYHQSLLRLIWVSGNTNGYWIKSVAITSTLDSSYTTTVRYFSKPKCYEIASKNKWIINFFLTTLCF